MRPAYAPTLIPVLLLGLCVLLPAACSEAHAGGPACCEQAAELIAQMDDCCAENLGKPVTEMTGCCTEGMSPGTEDRPECCSKALELHAQMSECCRQGMKSATDVCCTDENSQGN